MKKKRSKKECKFLIVHLAIFKVSVLISWEPDAKKIEKYIIKNAGSIPADFIETFNKHRINAIGLTLSLGMDTFIWLKTKPKRVSEYGTLYHELYHAVDFIAEGRNMQIKESEARAYIFEYIITKCNKYFWV